MNITVSLNSCSVDFTSNPSGNETSNKMTPYSDPLSALFSSLQSNSGSGLPFQDVMSNYPSLEDILSQFGQGGCTAGGRGLDANTGTGEQSRGPALRIPGRKRPEGNAIDENEWHKTHLPKRAKGQEETDRSKGKDATADTEEKERARKTTPTEQQGADLPNTSGEKELVNNTIKVGKGEVFDGKGKTYVAGKNLGDGGQSEGQKPVFDLEDGAILKNVNLVGECGGAADGVHCHGDAMLENVHWLDVGEDALTKKDPGNIIMKNCSMANGADKGIQDNAPGSIKCYNCTFDNLGKAYRTNGNQDFDASVEFYNCVFKNMKHDIARSDSPNFYALLSNASIESCDNIFNAPSTAKTVIA